MTKKIIMITGSALIGLITLLTTIFVMIATGAIEVEQKTIVFSSASAEAVYTGDSLVADEWEITSGELKEGHTAKVIVSGTQTTVGSSLNTLSATVVDNNGADVTDYYQIEYQPGTLKVFHRPLQVLANTATKVYDGTPLTCHQYTIASGELPAGHVIVPTYTSEITNVGTSENKISVIIKDATGLDVTSNYDVTTISGTLTVAKRQMYFQSESTEKTYDGLPLTGEIYTILSGELVPGHVVDPVFSGSITNAGTVINELSVTIKDSKGKDVTENYDVNVTNGTLTVAQVALQFQSETHEKAYDAAVYAPSEAELINGELVAGHTATINMLNTIINAGSVTNEFTVSIADANGVDVTSNYAVTNHFGTLTVTRRQITLRTASDIKIYDGMPLSNSNWDFVTGSVPDNDTLTVLMNSTITDAGSVENEPTITVTNASNVDVTDNYQFTLINGTLTVSARAFTLVSSSKTKDYDGTSLADHEVTELLIDLPTGYSIEYFFTQEITNIGTADNEFTAVIKDTAGKDVTSNFDIDYVYGQLIINPRPYSIITPSFEKAYDGTPLTHDGSYTLVDGCALVPDHTASIQFTGEQLHAGSSKNDFTLYIFDADHNDVTANYDLSNSRIGTLTVYKANIGLYSLSAEKLYDGTPLTNDGVYCTGTDLPAENVSLPTGHTIRYRTTGSQTDAGVSNNTFIVTILNSEGLDVTSDFEIERTHGQLLVSAKEVGLYSLSAEKVYDGTPLTKDGVYSIGTNAPAENAEPLPGYTLTYHVTGTQTDAGVSYNTFEVTILNSNGIDVTKNFKITRILGTLTVTKIYVGLYSNSASKSYDGTPLTNPGVFSIDNDAPADTVEPLPGYRITYHMTGIQTKAGTSHNTFTVAVLNNNDVDVTQNFAIERIYGQLTVMPIQIICASEDIVTFYSESRVECTIDHCKMVGGELLDGHSMQIVPLASSIDSCDIANAFHVVITDENGMVVTENYDITYLYGRLKILPRVLTVFTPSAHHTYDGKEFSCHEYTIEPTDALLEGHTIAYISFSPNATLIEAGMVKNEIAVLRIENANGEDVTRNYFLDYSQIGDIIVTPRPLTLRTPDAAKDYDGTPLTTGKDSWELVSVTQPLENHTLQAAVSGTRTEVGTSENIFAEICITDENGEYVTHNYAITQQLGTLTVKGLLPGGSGSGSGSGSGAGSGSGSGAGSGSGSGSGGGSGSGSGSGSGGGAGSGGSLNEGGGLGGGGGTGEGGENEDSVCFNVYSEKSGPVYLRMKSFGHFDPDSKGWQEATSYSQLLDGKFSYNYLTGVALKNMGVESIRIEIENFMNDQYFIPYFPDMYEADYDVQTSDVWYTGDASQNYSLYYYLYSGYGTNITANLGPYSSAELAYRSFVYDNYLYVDDYLAEYMQDIIDTNGFNASSNTIVYDVANYIQNAATYKLNYNTAIDSASHPIIAFLLEEEGLCRHYASAATALFRTLGIPARYTVGFVGNTKAEEWISITGKQAHAWTEIYIDGVGWIPVEVTGSGGSGSSDGSGGLGGGGGSNESGDQEDKPATNALSITPTTTYHKYDGNYAYPQNQVGGLTNLLAEGYTYTVTVEQIGSPKNLPGVYETKIKTFTLYDASRNDVTADFKISFNTGYLQIYLKEITVKTYGAEKVYDGTPLVVDAYTVEGALLNGHTLQSLICTGKQTNVGRSANNFAIVIVDENGLNITSHYKINRVCAMLTVTPKTIKITADSNTKAYDGTALTDTGYTLEGEVEGYTITVSISGSQTKIGYSDNMVSSVIIKDSQGKNVTSNFSIQCISGKLIVTPPLSNP